MKKSLKRGLAALLAALLIVPTNALSAAAKEEVVSNAIVADEVIFNTGNCEWSVVNKDTISGNEVVSGNETAFQNNVGDAYFEEDGSYTINIPEANPFFPYEVQFTCGEEVTNEWFMTPDDSVEIGGHTFYVSAYFDNTVVTQMSLNVAGDTVVVYPKEKEFTNDGGIMLLSLLPLEEKYLTVDLSAYTPAELTMISVEKLLLGENALTDMDKVLWTQSWDDNYTISAKGDNLDLSVDTYYSTSECWQVIVGDDDQLAADNVRYLIDVKLTKSEEWLKPTVYKYDSDGNRHNVALSFYEYYDYNKENRRWYIYMEDWATVNLSGNSYIKLEVNPLVFANPEYESFKIYKGQYKTATEAMKASEITSTMCGDAANGVLYSSIKSTGITIVTFNDAGVATGCLPVEVSLYNTELASGPTVGAVRTENGTENVKETYRFNWVDGNCYALITLYKGYAADSIYYVRMDYERSAKKHNELVTAAYVGKYSSIAEAQAAGAADIKGELFGESGYGANYSQGVDISIFIGEYGGASQRLDQVCVKTVEGDTPKYTIGSGTGVWFDGVKDANGTTLAAYDVNNKMDSYGEFNYVTLMVDAATDLTKLAPEFETADGVTLYATGGSSPEESGKSYHDFSKGPVQYTASAQNGSDSKNYWLQIVKATEGAGQLYVNSLQDASSNTKVENGIIYSTREIMLDGYHDDVHDIWLANIGTEAISSLSAELVSDVLELDDYWTFSGDYDLEGFSTLEGYGYYDGLPNQAKLRIRAKEGVESGAAASGTLTIKSGETTLMVLTLTGIIGDPSIMTMEFPRAVKYVPYGTMIQNNNKYSWNKTTYSLKSGILPDGMKIRENGELYGMPCEMGEFTFTVLMKNRYGSFANDTKTFTLVVNENTDANVEATTDLGYELIQRVNNLIDDTDLSVSQMLISQGEFAEFTDLYLDGRRLEKGTEYSAESGSTRITISNQTLSDVDEGTHTLSMEFRTMSDGSVKRAAQNYVVERNEDSDSGDDESEDNASESNDSVNSDSEDDEEANDDSTADNDNSKKNNVSNKTENSAIVTLESLVSGIPYTIKEGDSLWKIAEELYGSGAYWQQIYEDNADKISNPDNIYVGQVIILNPKKGVEAAMTADGSSYTVQAGDTLWKIAQKLYGKGWYWRKIYQANEGIIKKPEEIYVGQVIIIPE